VALGGVVGVVIATLFLVDETAYFGALQMLDWWIFVPVFVLVTALFVIVLRAVRHAMSGRVQTGREALVGRRGVVRGAFQAAGTRFTGSVFVDGARWAAECDGPLDDAERISVVAVLSQPMRLHVASLDTPKVRPDSK
jgi:membrane protein implicated in regulation of membrane protease activity